MANIQHYSVIESNNVALGQTGAKFISDTAVHTGIFVAITMLEDTVFNVLTPTDSAKGYGVGSHNGNSMASETVPQGITIFGRWSSIDLTSGLIIAYEG